MNDSWIYRQYEVLKAAHVEMAPVVFDMLDGERHTGAIQKISVTCNAQRILDVAFVLFGGAAFRLSDVKEFAVVGETTDIDYAGNSR